MKKPDSPTRADSDDKNSSKTSDNGAQSGRASVEVDPEGTKGPTHFPSQVHQMIQEIEEQAATNKSMKRLMKIIRWQDHGMAFKIHDRQKFIDHVMPKYFNRLKYSSWVRQLNLYGFKRIQREGNDKGALYHENFLRGLPALAATMTKVKKSKDPPRPSDDVEKEPDFERMVFVRVGVPMEHIFQRSSAATEEAKAASEDISPPIPYPSRESTTLAVAGQADLDTPILDESTSLRDMLLPVLNTGANLDSESKASSPEQQGNNDPFETLWTHFEEDFESVPHNDERLILTSSTPLSSTAIENTLDGIDVEPLRVFPPNHEHANTEHNQGHSEEGETKKPSYAAGA